MNTEKEKAKNLIIEAHKILLGIIVNNTCEEPEYKDFYIDQLYESSKLLLEVTRKLS